MHEHKKFSHHTNYDQHKEADLSTGMSCCDGYKSYRFRMNDCCHLFVEHLQFIQTSSNLVYVSGSRVNWCV